jgi:hypothetical protein
MKIPHFCAPIEFDKYLDKILVGIHKVGKPATSKEIADKIGEKDFECIGRSCSFMNYLGLTEGERSPFNLSTQGRLIAIAFHENKPERALELWKQTLRGHNLYAELKTYIEAQGGGRGSSLGFAEHFKTLAKQDWKGKHLKEGGKRVCELFSAKGLLTFDLNEDSISFPPPTSSLPAGNQPQTTHIPASSHPDESTGGTLQVQNKPSSNVLAYNINITVEAKDAQSIKEVVSLIRELKEQKLSN